VLQAKNVRRDIEIVFFFGKSYRDNDILKIIVFKAWLKHRLRPKAMVA
jgi:hypothetical protein